jgi:hypothetical protein
MPSVSSCVLGLTVTVATHTFFSSRVRQLVAPATRLYFNRLQGGCQLWSCAKRVIIDAEVMI